MKNIIKLLAGILFISFFFMGCTSVMRTDLESQSGLPEGYSEPIGRNSIVIIMTDMESVMDDPEPYTGRTVEMSGYVSERSFEGANDWNFILEDASANSINCYKWGSNDTDLTELEIALRQAATDGEEITVLGKFTKGKMIELESIEAMGKTYETNKPLWEDE